MYKLKDIEGIREACGVADEYIHEGTTSEGYVAACDVVNAMLTKCQRHGGLLNKKMQLLLRVCDWDKYYETLSKLV